MTPLTALKLARPVNKVGFLPGVMNIINDYGVRFLHFYVRGYTVGQAICGRLVIEKVAFTEAHWQVAKSWRQHRRQAWRPSHQNSRKRALRSVFDDADIKLAVKWGTKLVIRTRILTLILWKVNEQPGLQTSQSSPRQSGYSPINEESSQVVLLQA